LDDIKTGWISGLVATVFAGSMLLLNNALHGIPEIHIARTLSRILGSPDGIMSGVIGILVIGILVFGGLFPFVARKIPLRSYFAKGIALGARESIPVERLTLAEELELVRQMIQFNDVVEESVRELEPHRLVFYLLEFAGEFHRYYNRHRVVSEDIELSRARLLLLENVQKTIRQGLEILGVTAPLKMANRAEAEA